MLHIDPATLDYPLPENLIAQEPLEQRDAAKLLVLDRSDGRIEHKRFTDLLYYLAPGDVVVLNTAKVDRSRVFAKKKSGGRVELLFLGKTNTPGVWRTLLRPSVKVGTEIVVGEGGAAVVVGRSPEGELLVECAFDPLEVLEESGALPLPPYIKRKAGDVRSLKDAEYYQTVYASAPGSVAAPTAGLHFTADMLSQLKRHGTILVEIVLHVGWGTFRPIAESIKSHVMLEEKFEISAPAMREIVSARADRRRIVAVGTTATRALESLPDDQKPEAFAGGTQLFIRPGFSFRWVGGLVTNLHVPRSTPIALTAAFAGLANIEQCYDAAIRENYRFFSYGDAMLIL